jgi:pimeloyl-ACP methyl ester carboxylesterase
MTAGVVLVHGAWHGAWCFDRVIASLRKLGVEARALDLPGHGADPGPFGDLHADATRVGALLDRLDVPVVLVGHSYGGAVITEAGAHPAVEHLVYLCGFPLDAGETCQTAALSDAGAARVSHAGRPSLSGALMTISDGVTVVSTEGAATCFYNDCDSETIDWAVARLGPQPMVALAQSPTSIAWRHRPSTYVVSRDDQAVHPDLQRLLAQRCQSRVEWPTGHVPSLSRPDLVTDLLTRLVRQADEAR